MIVLMIVEYCVLMQSYSLFAYKLLYNVIDNQRVKV